MPANSTSDTHEQALKDAELRKARAEADRLVAEAEKAATEARRAAAVALRNESTAERDDQRAQEAAEAEHRRTVAEAQANAIKAFLPEEPELKPLEGDLSIDEKAGIVGEAAAYALMTDAAKIAAEKVYRQLPDGSRVLFAHDRNLVYSDWSYTVVAQQMTVLRAELDLVEKQIVELLDDSAPLSGIQREPEPDRELETDENLATEAPQPGLETITSLAAAGAVSTAPLAAVAALPTLVGAAADVAGYFQSNYAVAGRTFDAKVEPFVAATVQALAAKNADDNAEKSIDAVVDGFHIMPPTTIAALYEDLLKLRAKVAASIIDLERVVLDPISAAAERYKADYEARLKDQKTAESAKPFDQAHLDRTTSEVARAHASLIAAEQQAGGLRSVIENAGRIDNDVAAFVTLVTTPPVDGGLPPLGMAAVREVLHPRVDGQAESALGRVTHVAHVSVSTSGSETQTRRRRFFAPVVRYVGACVITVLVAKTDGTVVHATSDTLIGQLTYLIKEGKLGELRRVHLNAP